MAAETSPTPRFDLWCPAVEAGLLALPRLVTWADEQILRLSEPPLWLIELSLATDETGLRLARARVPEALVPWAGPTVDESRIYLGCLYLAFEGGAADDGEAAARGRRFHRPPLRRRPRVRDLLPAAE